MLVSLSLTKLFLTYCCENKKLVIKNSSRINGKTLSLSSLDLLDDEKKVLRIQTTDMT